MRPAAQARPAPSARPLTAPAAAQRAPEPERTLDTGGRRVDIREPRVEAARDVSADRPIARIVDPMVEDEEDLNQGDLYMDPPAPAPRAQPAITAPRTYARPAEPRRPEARRPEPQPEPEAPAAEDRKGGWRSLFGGRPRAEPAPIARPQPQLRTTWQAEPEAQETPDDLEIPSFLRRLAN